MSKNQYFSSSHLFSSSISCLVFDYSSFCVIPTFHSLCHILQILSVNLLPILNFDFPPYTISLFIFVKLPHAVLFYRFQFSICKFTLDLSYSYHYHIHYLIQNYFPLTLNNDAAPCSSSHPQSTSLNQQLYSGSHS